MTTRRNETAREWVDALEHLGRKVVAHTGYWMAQCPAHDDGNPSLRIKEDTDGGASIDCYAGCEFLDILKAVGFYRNAPSGAQGANAGVSRPKPPNATPAAKTPPKPRALPNGPTDTQYFYTSANGENIFAVVRHDWTDKPKTFTQWIPQGTKWLPTLHQHRSTTNVRYCRESLREFMAAWVLSKARSAPMPSETLGPESR